MSGIQSITSAPSTTITANALVQGNVPIAGVQTSITSPATVLSSITNQQSAQARTTNTEKFLSAIGATQPTQQSAETLSLSESGIADSMTHSVTAKAKVMTSGQQFTLSDHINLPSASKGARERQGVEGEIKHRAKRMVGGSTVEKGTPIRAVYVKIGEDGEHCTGSALTEDTILTAAHCVTYHEESENVCKFRNGTLVPQEILDRINAFDGIDGAARPVEYEDYETYSVEPEEITTTSAATSASTLSDDSYEFTFEEMPEDLAKIVDDMTCKPANITTELMPLEEISVSYGTELNDGFFQRSHKVKSIVYQPDYDGTVHDYINDIALIKLETPIKGVVLSSLPTKESNQKFRVEINANGGTPQYPHNLYAQGWGRVENPKVELNEYGIPMPKPGEVYLLRTNELKETRLTAVSRFGDTDTDCSKVVCSTDPNSEICSGDSGGPVYYKDPNTGDLVQVGVNAQGSLLCSLRSSMHADVYQHGDWIKKTMEVFGSNTAENRVKLHQQKASNDFNDHWDLVKDEYSHIDCNPKKVESLRGEARSEMTKADACTSSGTANAENCQAQQEKAEGYRNAYQFRFNNCIQNEKQPRSGDGLALNQRWDLTINKPPAPRDCFITNKDYIDVLRFSPDLDKTKAINVQPRQTVRCPEQNGTPLTEGMVTRPREQLTAAINSEPAQKLNVLKNGVFIRRESKASHAARLEPTSCHITNKSQKFVKFQSDNGDSSVLLMPSTTGECIGDNKLGINGRLQPMAITDFPEQAFGRLASVEGEREKVRIRIHGDVSVEGKTFVFNDKLFLHPVSSTDGVDCVIYAFETGEHALSKLRLIDNRFFETTAATVNN